jgi:hypothetical protein
VIMSEPKPIASNYQANYSLTMKIAGRRLFVLDNNIEG